MTAKKTTTTGVGEILRAALYASQRGVQYCYRHIADVVRLTGPQDQSTTLPAADLPIG